MREVKSCHPVEILCADSINVNGELNTSIGNLTYVSSDVIDRIDNCRNRIVPNQVLGLLVVELNATVDTVLPETIVDTYVEHACGLPSKVVVSKLCCSENSPAIALIGECCTCCTVSSNTRVSSESKGVTADTITQTKFQVVEYFLILHELFLCDIPCC